jgi:lysozyme family protein
MKDLLDDALTLIFGHEGGYVNVKTDRGGPTKYGVTQRTLSNYLGRKATIEDVKLLTMSTAEKIYRNDYAKVIRFDDLPAGLDYAVLDFAIHSGPKTAVQELQRVLGLREDGWVGSGTLNAIASYPGGVAELINDYVAARMDYLRGLTNAKTGFPVNGRGWTIRVTGVDPKGRYKRQPGVLGNALALAKEHSDELRIPLPKPRSMPAPATDETGEPIPAGKAPPVAPSVTFDPTVIGGLLTAILGPLSALSSDSPITWAVAAVFVVLGVVVGIYGLARVQQMRREMV